jgi:DNA-binding transcriptional LysR family regulator
VVDVPALLAKFRSAYPGVEIEVRQGGSTPMLDELASGRLDVAFVATAGHPVDGLDLRPLSTESMVMVCSAEHRLATASAVPLTELAGEAFVDFDPTWGARAISDHAFAAAGVAHPVTIEVNDVHTLLALVSHNLGVALVPERIAAKPGDHITVPLAANSADCWQVSVAIPTGSAASLAADALIGMLPTNRSVNQYSSPGS